MKVAVYLFAVGVLASVTLSADSISVSTGASWTPFSSVFNGSTQASPQPGVQGGPFWNNYSSDAGVGGSHDMNIGYMLSGTGGFTTTPNYFQAGDQVASTLLGPGESDPGSVTFTTNTAENYDVTLLGAYSGNSTMQPYGTQFGIYYSSGDSIVYDQLYGPGSGNSYTDTVPITLSGGVRGAGVTYGFYANVCYGALVNNVCANYETYYSNSALDFGYVSNNPQLFGNVPNYNHFALFGLNSDNGNYGVGNWVIAFKDGPVAAEGLGDFNDIVIELSDPTNFPAVPTVPEPATFAIMGSGLAGLAIMRRRCAKN